MIGIKAQTKDTGYISLTFFLREAAIESSKFDRARKKIVAAAECEENQAL